jgi:hypothetical protein
MSAYSVNKQVVECITIMMRSNEDNIFDNWSLCVINGYKLLPTMLSGNPDISRRIKYFNARFRQFHDFSNEYVSAYMKSISSVTEYTLLYNKRIDAHNLAHSIRTYSKLENISHLTPGTNLHTYANSTAGTLGWNAGLDAELDRFYASNKHEVAKIQPNLDKAKHDARDFATSFSESDKSRGVDPDITLKVALIIFMTKTMSIYNGGDVNSDDNEEKDFFECSYYIIEHFDSIVDGIMHDSGSYEYSEVIANYKDILIFALRDHIENVYISVSKTTLTNLISQSRVGRRLQHEHTVGLVPTYEHVHKADDMGSILRLYRNKLSIAYELLQDVNIIDLLNFKCAMYDIQTMYDIQPMSYVHTDINRKHLAKIKVAVAESVRTILRLGRYDEGRRTDGDASDIDIILLAAELNSTDDADIDMDIKYNNYDDEINMNKVYFVYKKHQPTTQQQKQIAALSAKLHATRKAKLSSFQNRTRPNELKRVISFIRTNMPSTTPEEKSRMAFEISMAKRDYAEHQRSRRMTPVEETRWSRSRSRIASRWENAGMNKYHRHTKHKHRRKKSSHKKTPRNKNPVKKYRTKRGKRYAKHKLTRKK